MRPFVLVVDDSGGMRVLVSELLSDEFDVAAAQELEDAISICQLRRPDAAVVDVLMRPLDGLAFVKALRADGFDPPVILMSALDRHTLERAALDIGAVAILTKPLARDELLAAVRAATASVAPAEREAPPDEIAAR